VAKAPEVEEEEEEPVEEECPKCPPVGAPAWMATFADMATLLMAFFVLILSFAEFNSPKFKQVAGSLKNSFGVQQLIPVMEQPRGTTVLSLDFSPSPAPSVSNNMTQQTTDEALPDIEVQTKSEDAISGDSKDQAGDAEGTGGKAGQTGSDGADGEMDAKALGNALQKAISNGEVTVEMAGQNVVVNFPSENTDQRDLPSLIKETLAALSEARQTSGVTDSEVLFGGIESDLNALANAAELASGEKANAADKALETAQAALASTKAGAAVDQLSVALMNEIEKGLVQIEQRDGKVFVTLGEGGSFPSGNALLTAEAEEILSRIAFATMEPNSTISVAGHTDDVPIFGGLYRDNWDLAAARASSVVQAIQNTGLVSADRMKAISFGETKPKDDNMTQEGREKNRRIEIEIDF
jgi:chemotaxis protein MotB